MRIIDAHAHLWKEADAEALLRAMEAFGIEAACISALIGGAYPSRDDVARANDMVGDAAREHDGRFIPFAYLNPAHGEWAREELERRAEQGFAGVKLWVAKKASAPESIELVRHAARLELPVLVHAWRKTTGNMPDESDPTDVAQLAKAVPDAEVIMAHIGGVFHVGVRAARTAPNLLVDTCGSLNDNGMVERAVRELGAERVVFGTDLPGFGANNIGKVRGAAIGEREKELVFSGNILRLLGVEEGI